MTKMSITNFTLGALLLATCAQVSYAADTTASNGFTDLLETCGTSKDARLDIAIISPFTMFYESVNPEDVRKFSDYLIQLDASALAEHLSQTIPGADPATDNTRQALDLRYEFKCRWSDDGLLVFHADKFGRILHENRVYTLNDGNDWLTEFFSGVLGSITP